MNCANLKNDELKKAVVNFETNAIFLRQEFESREMQKLEYTLVFSVPFKLSCVG